MADLCRGGPPGFSRRTWPHDVLASLLSACLGTTSQACQWAKGRAAHSAGLHSVAGSESSLGIGYGYTALKLDG